MPKVAVIVGSLRKESFNKKLAKACAAVAGDLFSFTFVDISEIPPYNQDQDNNMPAPVLRMKETVAAADAVLFVTPEYNRSVPGVLKNVVDWGSRPYGQNVWGGKPAAVAGTSPSAAGTAVAQSHLRSILTMLGMALISQPEVYITERPGIIAEDGTVTDESTKKFLRDFMSRFEAWVRRTQ